MTKWRVVKVDEPDKPICYRLQFKNSFFLPWYDGLHSFSTKDEAVRICIILNEPVQPRKTIKTVVYPEPPIYYG